MVKKLVKKKQPEIPAAPYVKETTYSPSRIDATPQELHVMDPMTITGTHPVQQEPEIIPKFAQDAIKSNAVAQANAMKEEGGFSPEPTMDETPAQKRAMRPKQEQQVASPPPSQAAPPAVQRPPQEGGRDYVKEFVGDTRWTDLLLGATPTLVGYMFGGAEGAGLGAEIGGKAMIDELSGRKKTHAEEQKAEAKQQEAEDQRAHEIETEHIGGFYGVEKARVAAQSRETVEGKRSATKITTTGMKGDTKVLVADMKNRTGIKKQEMKDLAAGRRNDATNEQKLESQRIQGKYRLTEAEMQAVSRTDVAKIGLTGKTYAADVGYKGKKYVADVGADTATKTRAAAVTRESLEQKFKKAQQDRLLRSQESRVDKQVAGKEDVALITTTSKKDIAEFAERGKKERAAKSFEYNTSLENLKQTGKIEHAVVKGGIGSDHIEQRLQGNKDLANMGYSQQMKVISKNYDNSIEKLSKKHGYDLNKIEVGNSAKYKLNAQKHEFDKVLSKLSSTKMDERSKSQHIRKLAEIDKRQQHILDREVAKAQKKAISNQSAEVARKGEVYSKRVDAKTKGTRETINQMNTFFKLINEHSVLGDMGAIFTVAKAFNGAGKLSDNDVNQVKDAEASWKVWKTTARALTGTFGPELRETFKRVGTIMQSAAIKNHNDSIDVELQSAMFTQKQTDDMFSLQYVASDRQTRKKEMKELINLIPATSQDWQAMDSIIKEFHDVRKDKLNVKMFEKLREEYGI